MIRFHKCCRYHNESRLHKSVGLFTILALMVITLGLPGGCPTVQNPGEVAQISESEIPAGIYIGDVTMRARWYLNGELWDDNTSVAVNETFSISNNGIPLDIASGKEEEPGLTATFDYSGASLTETTRNIVVAGDQVTVNYADTMQYYDLWSYADVTLKGFSSCTYTLQPDGSIKYISSMALASEYIADVGLFSVQINVTATAYP